MKVTAVRMSARRLPSLTFIDPPKSESNGNKAFPKRRRT
jgi:hypothetical protein